MLRQKLRLGGIAVACVIAALACLIVGGMAGNPPVFATGTIILGALGPLAIVYFVLKGIFRIE